VQLLALHRARKRLDNASIAQQDLNFFSLQINDSALMGDRILQQSIGAITHFTHLTV
jgi:hypothetical protein